jgi:hypothetical protein
MPQFTRRFITQPHRREMEYDQPSDYPWVVTMGYDDLEVKKAEEFDTVVQLS